MGKFCLAAIAVSLFACGPSTNGGGGDDAGGGVDAQPSCTPGDTGACYDGPSGTEGVGPCTSGTHTCQADGHWGSCSGETTPVGEVCGNGVDDNCNGATDEDVDLDGDGFTTCGGDCCDSTADGCTKPELVNPGAFEAPGNNLDDDCDGQVDEAAVTNCDTGLASQPSSLDDYAKALDICQSATLADKNWGVIQGSVQLLKPDGSSGPNSNQYAVRPSFGGTTVQGGQNFVVLSSGHAAAPGQTNPAFADFQSAAAIGTTSGFPADWYAANGNALPNAPGCPAPIGSTANDPVMLQLKVRTPTNAKSFSLNVNFFSAEYPEWTCSPYNDFFVVLLDSQYSGSPANPSDKNLAFYKNGNNTYPVGVNLAYGNTGLFTECVNGGTGCASGSTAGTISTCLANPTGLTSTGFDTANPGPNPSDPADVGYCPGNNLEGGGTGWLQTSGNVNGGEIITLRIAIWDTSDGILDSLAIIDNFQWSVDAAQPGTIIP